MTRDDSHSASPTANGDGTQSGLSALDSLGWQPFFAQQTDAGELAETPPVRIIQAHRRGLHAVGDGIDILIPPGPEATVGDWLLLDRANPAASRVLARKSLIKRRAPGSDRRIQLIAANIDTAFIVTSCNQDFNVARLERYIALAMEAGVTPVILLTKADLSESIDRYVEAATAISDLVPVITLDARGEEPLSRLAPWCQPGRTIAFLGSSGVGKSTLANALAENQEIRTQAIREDDAKGRHTTTRRQLHVLPGSCAVLDTPGMRGLEMTDAASGLADLFPDLHALTGQCRFNDCRHDAEPGCAVLAAVASGDIDAPRLARWKKLIAEEQFNTASLAERKASGKALGKTSRQTQKRNRKKSRS